MVNVTKAAAYAALRPILGLCGSHHVVEEPARSTLDYGVLRFRSRSAGNRSTFVQRRSSPDTPEYRSCQHKMAILAARKLSTRGPAP